MIKSQKWSLMSNVRFVRCRDPEKITYVHQGRPGLKTDLQPILFYYGIHHGGRETLYELHSDFERLIKLIEETLSTLRAELNQELENYRGLSRLLDEQSEQVPTILRQIDFYKRHKKTISKTKLYKVTSDSLEKNILKVEPV